MKNYLRIANKSFGLLIIVLLTGCSSESNSNDQESVDLILHNAKITTLDEADSEHEALAIKDMKVFKLGSSVDILKLKGEDTEVIDLKQRRVIPGLIDSHIHFVRQGNYFGHLVQQAENSYSIHELLETLSKASLDSKEGEFITVMGGLVLGQLEEARLPTVEEIDAVISDKPVYIQNGFSGPSVVNSKGLEVLEEMAFDFDLNGEFAKGEESVRVYHALNGYHSELNSGTKNLVNLITYANSVGLTMVHDEGGTNFPNSSNFDVYNGYDRLMELDSKKALTLKFRIQHVVYDEDTLDGLVEEKINNTWQGFGSDMVKIWTMGEHVVSFPRNGKVKDNYYSKILKIALDGWTHEQHSANLSENKQHLDAIERVNSEVNISELRWSLAHVFELGESGTEDLLQKILDLDLGLKVQNHGYHTETDKFPLGRDLGRSHAGPLYKALLENDIPMGAGTDGPLLGPMNPWLSIYYMISGKNVTGEIVNPDQQISRVDALRMYTLGSAWFTFEEKEVGSIEEGKFADIVVLDSDYFEVDDENVKLIQSVLTLVNGQVVYNKLD